MRAGELGAACEICAREELPCWCKRLVRGVRRLNEGPLRASRGWRAAAQLDRTAGRPDHGGMQRSPQPGAPERVAPALAGALAFGVLMALRHELEDPLLRALVAGAAGAVLGWMVLRSRRATVLSES